ncbi:hypothetical protein ACHAWF_015872 [Thalassiosira exigua]
MASDNDGATTARRVRTCVFLIELSLAAAVVASIRSLFRILLPLGGASSASYGAPVSTLAGAWIVLSAWGVAKSSRERSAREEDSGDGNCELSFDDGDDPLKSYERRRKDGPRHRPEVRSGAGGKKVKVDGGGNAEDEAANDIAAPSEKIADARRYLRDIDNDDSVARAASRLLALLVMGILQFAVRIFVILHNLRRSFRPRRRSARGGFMDFSQIPFTIGSAMSSSGCSFVLFSFLNKWLEFREDDRSRGSGDMALQAVSFDRMSINSTHLLVRNRLSLLGIAFEDVDLSLAVILKRKGRRSGHGNSDRAHSLKIRLKIDLLEVGMFPLSSLWCRASGIHFGANASIDSNNLPVSGARGWSGFGMSVTCGRLDMRRYTSRHALDEVNPDPQRRMLFAWDTMDSSLHLIRRTRRELVSLLSFPPGLVVVDEPEKGAARDSGSAPRTSRRAYVSLRDSPIENCVALGMNLTDLRHFVSSVDWLLGSVSSSRIGAENSYHTRAPTQRAKRKPSVEVVEVNANLSIHVYVVNAGECLDYYSFEVESYLIHCERCNQVTTEPMFDDSNLIMAMDSRGASFRHDVFSNHGLDDCNISLDLVSLNQLNAKVDGSKAAIDLGRFFVRTDAEVIDKLACVTKGSKDIALAVVRLKKNATQSTTSKETKQQQVTGGGILRSIEVSCNSVDAIIELQGGTQTTDRVRLALLQGETHTTIIMGEGRLQEEPVPTIDFNSDLRPGQLFDCEAIDCSQHYRIEATVAHAEGSVTFHPHPSLPVVDDPLLGLAQQNQETSFFGTMAKLSFKSVIPLSRSRVGSVARPTHASKAVSAAFEELNIFERFSKKAEMVERLLSIPVHDLSRTTASAFIKYCDHVKILHCKGHICLVEKWDGTDEGKVQLISIQFTRGPADLEVVWSPIFQWTQVSLSKCIQKALARLKSLASDEPATNKRLTSLQTDIRIEFDSTANIRAFVGTQSLVQIIMEGGTTMKVSATKRLPPSETTLKQITKPEISFQATHIEVLLNGIRCPIFTFDGISIQNYFREASVDEVDDFLSKRHTPMSDCYDDVLTNESGHPLKEIFDMHLGNTWAKFPPDLLFGEVIEDFVLLPKALAYGLNQLKEEQQTPTRKYVLMTIKCIIPFLDMSLMGNDLEHRLIDARSKQRRSFSGDPPVFRLCLEATDVTIERNTPPEVIQSQINALDEDDTLIYTYGPAIQGGLVCLIIKHVMCTLHPLNLATPLARIDNFAINGHLHLASLSPTFPGVQEGKTVTSMLLCHHQDENDSRVLNCGSRQCRCRYGVSLYSAGIPVKVYTDSRVTCKGLDISFGDILKNHSIPSFLECIKRLLPPKPPPPPSSSSLTEAMPLPWWDNNRFFVHGSVSVASEKLSFRWLLDSHIHCDQSILFVCQKFVIAYTLGSFEINTREMQLSVPNLAYDMSVHPSARNSEPTFHLPYEAESVVGRGRFPLLYVPYANLKIKVKWDMLLPEGSSRCHHSVYMKSSANSGVAVMDKFAPFRSDGVNAEIDFDLQGSDAYDNWVALRIDLLPWLTHINKAVTYSLQPDEDKPDPLPTLKSMAIRASASRLRLATWFEETEDDCHGLVLIVKRVNYDATADGSKDIVIEGPVKAAILDLNDFKHTESVDRDVLQDNEIASLEHLASVFGASEKSRNLKPNKQFPRKDVSPFAQLQQLSRNTSTSNEVVVTGQIDIHNKSLSKILGDGENDGAKKLERKESNWYDCIDRTTWSILVSRLKLLWTIKIRDAITAVVKDLIFTIGFMKSQKRQLQVLREVDKVRYSRETLSPSVAGVKSLHETPGGSEMFHNSSMLEYLLEESFDLSSLHDLSPQPHASFDKEEKEGNALPTLPTLDIHLSNPQVQLHSTATGGSIVLGAEAAHVEGRKFVHFLVANSRRKAEKVSPSDLLRKTEHMYTITNMEAYSLSTDIDVSVGLPWLGVCSPRSRGPGKQAFALEERFGISESQNQDNLFSAALDAVKDVAPHEYTYPSYLRHHEPFSFSSSGLLRPILAPFTFQSRQVFHRPPIHYSNEELITFIQSGLVVNQDEAAVDNIELQIDLLSFNLDSYQFKTTIDVIRNVLLEPPKPHQRHQSFNQDETDVARKTSSCITSVAATEMEELLGNITRGKKARQKLQGAAISLLRDIEDQIAFEGTEVFRRIHYTLGKLLWSIQSDEEIDDVQISFTGFDGQHDYSRDGSIVSQISLEDVLVSSSRPGPDSMRCVICLFCCVNTKQISRICPWLKSPLLTSKFAVTLSIDLCSKFW